MLVEDSTRCFTGADPKLQDFTRLDACCDRCRLRLQFGIRRDLRNYLLG